MRNSLLRAFLILEFLVALIAVFTVWSQVGGQYHLDLMFWPWKLGVGLSAAALIVGITFDRKRTRLYGGLLILVAITAGLVTYYYHQNEPDDEDDNGDQPTKITRTLTRRDMRFRREP